MYQIPLPGRTATVFFTHKSDKTYVINRFMRFTQSRKKSRLPGAKWKIVLYGKMR